MAKTNQISYQNSARDQKENMNILTKLISGSSFRKTRLHDEKGNFVPWKNAVLHIGPALISGLLRISIGYRPELPWIAYKSISFLKDFLNKNARVLEFGSGMSTIWFAKQSGEVCSVDDDYLWYEKITKLIKSNHLDNVTYKLAENEIDYHTFMSDDKMGFDLIMVDGKYRSKCIYSASKLVKRGGILYLDNSDRINSPDGPDMKIAVTLARNIAANLSVEVIEVTDFAPTQFFVQQGLLIKFPS